MPLASRIQLRLARCVGKRQSSVCFCIPGLPWHPQNLIGKPTLTMMRHVWTMRRNCRPQYGGFLAIGDSSLGAARRASSRHWWNRQWAESREGFWYPAPHNIPKTYDWNEHSQWCDMCRPWKRKKNLPSIPHLQYSLATLCLLESLVWSLLLDCGSWDEYLKLVIVCNLSCWKLVVTSVFLFLSFLGDFYPWRWT